MDERLHQYLQDVQKKLKYTSTSQKIDIISDMKVKILDMQRSNYTTEQILDRLPRPEEIYDKDEDKGGLFRRIWYWLTTILGIIVIIPLFAILSFLFAISGVIFPIGGVVKLVGYFAGFEVPSFYVNFNGEAIATLPACFVLILEGIVAIIIAKIFWKVIKGYVGYIKTGR